MLHAAYIDTHITSKHNTVPLLHNRPTGHYKSIRSTDSLRRHSTPHHSTRHKTPHQRQQPSIDTTNTPGSKVLHTKLAQTSTPCTAAAANVSGVQQHYVPAPCTDTGHNAHNISNHYRQLQTCGSHNTGCTHQPVICGASVRIRCQRERCSEAACRHTHADALLLQQQAIQLPLGALSRLLPRAGIKHNKAVPEAGLARRISRNPQAVDAPAARKQLNQRTLAYTAWQVADKYAPASAAASRRDTISCTSSMLACNLTDCCRAATAAARLCCCCCSG